MLMPCLNCVMYGGTVNSIKELYFHSVLVCLYFLFNQTISTNISRQPDFPTVKVYYLHCVKIKP